MQVREEVAKRAVRRWCAFGWIMQLENGAPIVQSHEFARGRWGAGSLPALLECQRVLAVPHC